MPHERGLDQRIEGESILILILPRVRCGKGGPQTFNLHLLIKRLEKGMNPSVVSLDNMEII